MIVDALRMECAPRVRSGNRHEPTQVPPTAGDADHGTNALNANPITLGSRTATSGQPAMRSTSFTTRSVPSKRPAAATTNISSARIRNAAGVDETEVENQSRAASRTRARRRTSVR